MQGLESLNDTKDPFNLAWIAPWVVVKDSAGHHTWHEAIHKIESANIRYFGLQNPSNPIWLQPLFNSSIKRRFKTISPFVFYKLSKQIRSKNLELNCVALFEGSFFWAFLMGFMSIVHPKAVYICNLWPASKYFDLANSSYAMKQQLRFCLKIVNAFSRLQITVETRVLADFLEDISGVSVKVFPVPSSLNYRIKERRRKSHSKVLLNIRQFDRLRLREVLQESCTKCSFHISSYKNDTDSLSDFLQNYKNVVIESHSTDDKYESYIDSFDHAVFLYQPIPLFPGSFSHYCASGRLQDVLLRRIPVSIPDKGKEWINLARRWGSLSTFDFDSNLSVASELNHPDFSGGTFTTPPHLRPLGLLNS